jgi:hypothetical protein
MISPQGVLPGSAAPAALLQNPQGAAPWPRTQNWGGASYYSDVENTFRTILLTGRCRSSPAPKS